MYSEITLTNAEKWRPVDRIIEEVNRLKAEGKHDQLTYIQRYIDKEFNLRNQRSSHA